MHLQGYLSEPDTLKVGYSNDDTEIISLTNILYQDSYKKNVQNLKRPNPPISYTQNILKKFMGCCLMMGNDSFAWALGIGKLFVFLGHPIVTRYFYFFLFLGKIWPSEDKKIANFVNKVAQKWLKIKISTFPPV